MRPTSSGSGCVAHIKYARATCDVIMPLGIVDAIPTTTRRGR